MSEFTETAQMRLERMMGARDLECLQRSKVAVFGVGLLGGGVAMHLGMLGTPQIIVDPSLVDAANLGNQAFPADQLGKSKAVARAEQIRALHPGARVRWMRSRLEDVGLGAFADASLLVSGLDSRVSRLRVAELSQIHRVPWLDMGCDGSGERLQGYVSYYDPRRGDAPCYGCKYDSAALDQVRREGRGPGCPSWSHPELRPTPPTLQSSAFGALISGLAALWLVSALTGRDDGIANTQLQVHMSGSPSIRPVALQRSAHCPLAHQPLGPLSKVGACTLGELFERAQRDLEAKDVALHLHHRSFVGSLRCPTCGESVERPRLSKMFHPDELVCPHHPAGCERVPTSLLGHLTRGDIHRFGSVGWDEIGLPKGDIVTAVADGAAPRHYVVGRA